jgi:3-hydroxyisobutyrate dehydrogenase
MSNNKQKLGWIGVGRMGYQMAERLLNAGHDVSIWNRTKAKAEPLAKLGGRIVDNRADLAGVDVLFTIVSTGSDLEEVYFGDNGIVTRAKGTLPKIFVDCSTIAVEDSAHIAARLEKCGVDFVSAPVSGNALVVRTRGRRQAGATANRGVRAQRRVLCRRGRARAHL